MFEVLHNGKGRMNVMSVASLLSYFSDHFHVTKIQKVMEEVQIRNIYPLRLCICFLSKTK